MYLLDTNIFSYIYKGNNQNLLDKINSVANSDICFGSIVLAELIFGSYNNHSLTTKLLEYYTLISKEFVCYDFEIESAKIFGVIKNNCNKKGKTVDDMDLMIASICIANDLTLVTNNTKHFVNIENLKLENWV